MPEQAARAPVLAPHPHAAITARGHHVLALRIEGALEAARVMLAEHAGAAGREIPYAHRAIEAGADQGATVRRKRDPGDSRRVPGELLVERAVAHFEHAHDAILIA